MPTARFGRWVENFGARHGTPRLEAGPGLSGHAEDGSWFRARLPFGAAYEGPPDVGEFVSASSAPLDWGIVLARRGGFAVARMAGEEPVASKVGQRHVQGRTKAGGQSQQRFARRRDNQARQAWAAAADHARARLADLDGPLVLGGDAAGVETVLELAGLTQPSRSWVSTVGEPRRDALAAAIVDALAVEVVVHNA